MSTCCFLIRWLQTVTAIGSSLPHTDAFITATLAAPGNAPLLQVGETEPNDSFEEADALAIPGYVIGVVSNTPVTETIDYFVMNTTIGREYQASLTVDSPQDLKLRMVLYDGDRGYLQTSSSSSTGASMSWSSDKDSHYIRVEAVTVSTSTVKIADYRLDIDLIAVTSTPTNTPPPGEDEYEPNNDKGTAHFDASRIFDALDEVMQNAVRELRLQATPDPVHPEFYWPVQLPL